MHTAADEPTMYSYRWLVDGAQVPDVVTNTYTLSDVTRDHDQTAVACEATNTVGSTMTTHVLNVTCKYKCLLADLLWHPMLSHTGHDTAIRITASFVI